MSDSGNINLESVSMMVTDENWILFEDQDDREVVRRLASQKRYFAKGLRYNLSRKDIIASALITDLEEPNAIDILPAESEEDYKESLDRIIKESSIESTLWDIDGCQPLVIPDKQLQNCEITPRKQTCITNIKNSTLF